MTMTEKQWKASFDKWYNVCETLARWSKPALSIKVWMERHEMAQPSHWLHENVYGNCTYCKEYARDYWNDHPGNNHAEDEKYTEEYAIRLRYNCALCPLYRAGACADTRDAGPRRRFWLLVKAVNSRRWEHAHIHAVKILQAITDSKLEVTGRSVDDYLRNL